MKPYTVIVADIVGGTKPSVGLTNPLPRPRGPMKPRLDTALVALSPHKTIDDVVALLDEHPRPTSQPCLRRACDRPAVWPDRGGQPQGFCSDGCRRRYVREREQLLLQEAELVECLNLPGSFRKRRKVELALVAVRWQLQRFPNQERVQ